MGNTYMAIDLEENKGRMTLGYVIDGKLKLEEVHHFEFCQKEIEGVFCDDVDTIVSQIKIGLSKCKEMNKLPVLVGVNEWNSEIIYQLCHINTLSPLVVKPGSVIGSLAMEVTEEVWYDCIVLISATKQVKANIEQVLLDEKKESEILTISNILFLMFFSHEISNLHGALEYIK